MRYSAITGAVSVLLLLTSCGADQDPGTAEPTESAPASSAESDASGAEEPDENEQDGTSTAEPEDGPTDSEPVSEASWNPDSVHVLVNKHNPLDPQDYAPEDLRLIDAPQEFGEAQLREEAATAYEKLHAAAADDGVNFWVTTAYRDFGFQKALYDQRLQADGAESADRVSARPGYSEHQTGLAADVADLEDRECYLRACFGESEQGRWLTEHAHEFGFVIRYPEDGEENTGYQYEPWHLRYVGEETAQDVAEQGVTLEEYWGQDPAPDYLEEYGN